jgi:hypothetical protein
MFSSTTKPSRATGTLGDFSDPECALSGIKAAFEQRFSIKTGGTQINCDEMQSFSASLGQRAQFLTLCCRMIHLPKFRTRKIQLRF